MFDPGGVSCYSLTFCGLFRSLCPSLEDRFGEHRFRGQSAPLGAFSAFSFCWAQSVFLPSSATAQRALGGSQVVSGGDQPGTKARGQSLRASGRTTSPGGLRSGARPGRGGPGGSEGSGSSEGSGGSGARCCSRPAPQVRGGGRGGRVPGWGSGGTGSAREVPGGIRGCPGGEGTFSFPCRGGKRFPFPEPSRVCQPAGAAPEVRPWQGCKECAGLRSCCSAPS